MGERRWVPHFERNTPALRGFECGVVTGAVTVRLDNIYKRIFILSILSALLCACFLFLYNFAPFFFIF